MKSFRSRFSPLASDTISPIDLPPVRLGLHTKLNLLVVGLIFLTAVATTGYYLWQRYRVEDSQLRTQGSTVVQMLAELSEYGLYTNDVAYLTAVVDSIAGEGDVAYVAMLDGKRQPVAERRFAESLGGAPLPALGADTVLPPIGATVTLERTLRGRRYIELIAPVGGDRSNAARGLVGGTDEGAGAIAPAARAPGNGAPIGWVRLGMTFERLQGDFRRHLYGALTVVGLLVILAIGATLLLTRRLVAPMRRLMRAARAVGSGKLDVYVPARSSDEVGLLTHTFNHMTQRLAESQSEVANYQRTLEDKVAQRTKELEIATAHAYKLAQHDILTGLPNRSLLNQQIGRAHV